MSKKMKTFLIVSALVLLLIGMGCTMENHVVAQDSAAVEAVQPAPEDHEVVDPPADLTPAYLPEGYELAEAYLIDGAEFEEDAIWFIPGKGTATIVEFWGTGDEDFLEIIASESPYDSLDPWIAEVSAIEFDDEEMDADEVSADDEDFDDEDYSFEDDLVTINGVSVLLEDWSDDEYGSYSAATFIANGQFIVVEGTLSVDELTKVIESLPVLP